MRINEGVYHYLKSYCSPLEAPKHVHDTLQIISDKPVDADRFQSVLHDAVEKDIEEFDRQSARNNRRVIWESFFGVFLCALCIMLSVRLDELLLTVISLLGTMGIKDAVTIVTTFNHDIKSLKKLLDPIRDIRLEVIQQNGITAEGNNDNEIQILSV